MKLVEICTGLGKGIPEHRAVAAKLGCASPETVGALEEAVKEVSCSVIYKSLRKRKAALCVDPEGGDNSENQRTRRRPKNKTSRRVERRTSSRQKGIP